jgi:type I restriction enzyme M protein
MITNVYHIGMMTEMSQTLYGQMEKSKKLDEVIRKNMEGFGYGK